VQKTKCPKCGEVFVCHCEVRIFSVADVAKKLGVTTFWVRRLGKELIKNGHAKLIGRSLVLFETAVNYIRNRPDGRGRPIKKVEK